MNRLIIVLVTGLSFTLLKSQSFFIEPVIQSKVQLLARSTPWYNNNNTLSYKSITYLPIKVYAQRFPPLDFGLNFGYSHNGRSSISFGILTETPQIGYTINYLPYDPKSRARFFTDIGATGKLFLIKFPVASSVYLGSANSKSLNWNFKSFLLFSVAFGKIKNNVRESVHFSSIRLDSTTYFYGETVLGAEKQRFQMLSLGYGLEVKYKRKSIIQIKAFMDFGFKTLAYQVTTITISDNKTAESIGFANIVKGTGFGIQLSKKFNWSTARQRLIREIAAKNIN